jgi:hypothetical protein
MSLGIIEVPLGRRFNIDRYIYLENCRFLNLETVDFSLLKIAILGDRWEGKKFARLS